MSTQITIYTDGSSIGNPGPGGWGAIVWYEEGRVKELGGREDHTTNNRMELQGAIESLEYVLSASRPAKILTDSSYLVNGVTKWIYGWQKNGWITTAKEPVLNKELWEELFALAKKVDVEWLHVPAHAGVLGNERVDEIARGLALKEKVTLYEGSYKDYGMDLSLKKVSNKNAGKIYSYLSLVGGEVKRHVTWEECEKRVKGAKGARYKKTFSADEEERILDSWGATL